MTDDHNEPPWFDDYLEEVEAEEEAYINGTLFDDDERMMLSTADLPAETRRVVRWWLWARAMFWPWN